MEEIVDDVNQRIAERVKALRSSCGFTLEALAAKSGVSRSMISVIERGESSPTAAVLDKLAVALNVTMPELFAAPGSRSVGTQPLVRRDEQPCWRDPESGYLRRNVSPPGPPQPMQIVEVRFPPGARVAFENGARDVNVYQQVWLLEGTMNVTVGERQYRLAAGDCLAMQLDAPTMFHNPTRKLARYAVVIASEPRSKR